MRNGQQVELLWKLVVMSNTPQQGQFTVMEPAGSGYQLQPIQELIVKYLWRLDVPNDIRLTAQLYSAIKENTYQLLRMYKKTDMVAHGMEHNLKFCQLDETTLREMRDEVRSRHTIHWQSADN